MNYIRRVHLDDPGTWAEHISQVQYSTTTWGPLITASREQVVRAIEHDGESFRSRHDRAGTEADVVTKRSSTGTPYITTVADGRETNNLLELPRF